MFLAERLRGKTWTRLLVSAFVHRSFVTTSFNVAFIHSIDQPRSMQCPVAHKQHLSRHNKGVVGTDFSLELLESFFISNVLTHSFVFLPETCPKCGHLRAYFMQIQTRSADEPMTTFYKCCNAQCGHRWRD